MIQLLSKTTIVILFIVVPAIAISADFSGADINSKKETSVYLAESFSNQVVEAGEDESTVLDSERENLSEQIEFSASQKASSKPDVRPNEVSAEQKALEDINNTLKSAIVNLSKESSMPTYQKFLIGSGVLGFLIAVFNLFLTFVYRSEDKAKSIIDDFWLREVIIPRTIEPIEEKILNNKFRHQDLKSLKAVEINELIKSLDDLRYSISIIDVISRELTDDLEELLDELSITVATRSVPALVYGADQEFASTQTADDPFLNCYRSMLFVLIQTHKGLNVKRIFNA